ncbi:MAG: hypothetical protein J6C93_02390 [Clostridia bacterium]|nr:hypothetical protein [Clostridia bacterium]
MINLYTDADLYDAVVQRRKILTVYFTVLAVYLGAVIGFFIYYAMLPYEDPNQTWVKWVTFALTFVFLFFSFPFIGIKFRRSNSYVKMLKFISVGLKEYTVAPFAEIDDWTTRDGVDVNVANFTVRGVKRGETMIRSIYVDGEKDYPPFEKGQYVKIISQGNLLIGYEPINRWIVEAEENGQGEELCEQS